MRVVILPSSDDVSAFAAKEIVQTIESNPAAVLGLATGGTPLGVYRRLIELHRAKKVSFREVATFNLDEYVGLAPDHPASYRHYMNENLFNHIDILSSQTHLPHGAANDLGHECENYEALIREHRGIDLQLLGIGTDGHIGFNEQGSSLGSRTRLKTLTARTRLDNSRFFSTLDEVPTAAITVGIATILESRRILLLATGEGKAAAIKSAVEGPVSSFVPASALQLHPDVTVIIDEAAAKDLVLDDYYRQSEQERARLELR